LSYAAAVGGRESESADRLLRRDRSPLGVQRHYEPADDSIEDAASVNRKWTFGVAAGALLVAGTFAAGALGLNGGALPVADENSPEHAPSAPGHGQHGSGGGQGDIGTPAVAAPPHGERDTGTADRGPSGQDVGASGQQASAGSAQGGVAPAPPATPAPAPAPAPRPAEPAPGPVEKVVQPVTDTVGNVTRPVTETVGGVLSPVTGTLTGGGDQPALTMIDPLGDLLGS
jgi:hypothetical protein